MKGGGLFIDLTQEERDWWIPLDGVLKDYSDLPLDLVRVYFMPIRSPLRVALCYERPFDSNTLRLRLVCKKWKTLLDSYDAFWQVMQPEKTHATYFLSAMALMSERYITIARNKKKAKSRDIASIKGKIARREEGIKRLQDELEEFQLEEEDLRDDMSMIEKDQEAVVLYRKNKKFKMTRRKK